MESVISITLIFNLKKKLEAGRTVLGTTINYYNTCINSKAQYFEKGKDIITRDNKEIKLLNALNYRTLLLTIFKLIRALI